MKIYLAVFLLLHSLVSGAQKMKFNVLFSEPLAVFEFVRNIGDNNPANAYKDVFDSSTYNTTKYKALLSQFQGINYAYVYEYTQYPYGNKIDGNTYFLLSKNLIESQSIEEFRHKSIGIIPNADLSQLCVILDAFVPVYRQLILYPNKEELEQLVSMFRKKIAETNIGYYIEKVKLFHNSTWDISQPFTINICPTSGQSKDIHATAFFNYAYANVPVNQRDMALMLSFMFHESFHMIYDEQSLAFKQQFENWFRANPSKYSRYAELLFNEAITTALSSGYLYNALSKSPLPPDKWYSNKHIDSMALAIYPLTLSYLGNNSQIDSSFINNYISIYERNFPHWLFDIDNILADRYIVYQNTETFNTVRRKFRYRNIQESAQDVNLQHLQTMKSKPITKIILLDKAGNNELTMIKQTFAELKNWNPPLSTDFAVATFLPDKTYLIVINSLTKPADELISAMSLPR